jgi:hypothetical protein
MGAMDLGYYSSGFEDFVRSGDWFAKGSIGNAFGGL